MAKFWVLGVRHGREVSTPDCCKAVPGSNPDPAPPKLKIHAAIDGHPICRISPKFVDYKSHGSESTKKKKKKKKKKREQWWLIGGSSGGSLVATLDCKTAVLGSNPAISPAYSGLPVLRWAATWDGTSL